MQEMESRQSFPPTLESFSPESVRVAAPRPSSTRLNFHRPSLEMCCNVQSKAQSQAGRRISLPGRRVGRRGRNSAYRTTV